MLHDISYMPILRSKAAEFECLKQLIDADRRLVTPLIDIWPSTIRPPDILKGLTKIAQKIDNGWYSHPICIDVRHVGIHIPGLMGYMLGRLYSALRQLERPLCPELRPQVVPVTGLLEEKEYEATVRAIVSQEQAGLCLRLPSENIRSMSLQSEIDYFMSRFGCTPRDVYLVVDFKFVDDSYTLNLTDMCSRLPYIMQWKNIVVAAGSFPEDLQGIEVGEQTLPRYEWCAWHKQVTGSGRLPRFISFGDYGIYHPLYKEDVEWAPSASIRYASTEHWRVMRGRKPNTHNGGPGSEQYLQEAVALSECEEYQNCGPGYSAANLYIAQKVAAYHAGNLKNPGNPEQWIGMGFNHHLTLTGRNVAAVREAFLEAVSTLAA